MLEWPAFFFPSTVCILDDDEYFSRILTLCLGESFNIRQFSSSRKLEEYFDREIAKSHLPVLSNAQAVRSHIDDDKKAMFVSVILADYHLENVTGLDVLSQLKSRSVQKLLISNYLETSIIDDAFRARHINAYLPKFDNNFIAKLKTTVTELQWQFFLEYSFHHHECSQKKSKLNDIHFAKYMKQMFDKFVVSHMVANDDLNVFDMASADGKQFSIHIVVENDFLNLSKTSQWQNASASVIKDIEERRAYPCFPMRKILDGEMWQNYMTPVELIGGDELFYVARTPRVDA